MNFEDDDTEYTAASEDDIEKVRSKAVRGWFKRLEKAMPADGDLTAEVVRAVGKLPAILDPYGLEDDRESEFFEARVFAQASAAAQVETVVALAYGERAQARESNGKDHPNLIDLDAKVRYWKAVSRWIASMERDA